MKKLKLTITTWEHSRKFAKAAIRIMLEMLRCMMKKKEPPILSINGRMIYLTEHVMKLFGFSVRKIRQLRADDEIEYMISKDGSVVFHYEHQVQEYIDRTFVSSRSPEGMERRKLRNERFNNLGTS